MNQIEIYFLVIRALSLTVATQPCMFRHDIGNEMNVLQRMSLKHSKPFFSLHAIPQFSFRSSQLR